MKRNRKRASLMSASLMVFVVIGIAGWLMLILPSLHFIYKDYLGLLGEAKWAALCLAALGMFVVFPCWLIQRLYRFLDITVARIPAMIIACGVAVYLGRMLM